MMLFHCPLASFVAVKKSAVGLMAIPFYVIYLIFSFWWLLRFFIFIFPNVLWSHCDLLGMTLYWFILLGTPRLFSIWEFISFINSKELIALFSPNIVFPSFSPFSPSGMPIRRILKLTILLSSLLTFTPTLLTYTRLVLCPSYFHWHIY